MISNLVPPDAVKPREFQSRSIQIDCTSRIELPVSVPAAVPFRASENVLLLPKLTSPVDRMPGNEELPGVEVQPR